MHHNATYSCLTFYLEIHPTSNKIYFIWLRNLARNSVHYASLWMAGRLFKALAHVRTYTGLEYDLTSKKKLILFPLSSSFSIVILRRPWPFWTVWIWTRRSPAQRRRPRSSASRTTSTLGTSPGGKRRSQKYGPCLTSRIRHLQQR